MKNTTETILYQTGWILLILAIPAYFFLEQIVSYQLPCILLYFTGIYCPGCGGTRAVLEFFKGHPLRSFFYHPFVLYCAILYLWFMVSQTIQRLSHNRLAIGMKYRDIYLYIGLAIILLNWILRNIWLPI